jgi:hypothetical protein
MDTFPPDATPRFRARPVERLIAGQATQDGAGVRLTRLLTPDLQRRLDPFLMLDAFGSDRPDDYIAGFPDHPHRGFETVTVMLDGRMRHRDSAGNEGLLVPGGVQWMTAGRGVIHSEMPEQQEGRMAGFQLWLNLPARDKLREPWYRDIAPDEVPVATAPGAQLRVIAGEALGIRGLVERPSTEPLLLDVRLDAGATLELPLPATHNAFVAVAEGRLTVGDRDVAAPRMAILATPRDGLPGDGVRLHASAGATRALVAAGRPLHEPIAQLGPFVMNTREELMQAVEDFRRGVLA